jgi:hypothetical protein
VCKMLRLLGQILNGKIFVKKNDDFN